ncbi:MAG: serpin family protein [Candidatus Obscuribacterales bacterium]
MKRFLAWSLVALACLCDISGTAAFAQETAAGTFPVDLFRETAKGKSDKNVLVSPFSAATALTMAYAGSEGGTREAMARVLGLPAEDEKAYAAQKALLDSLSKPGDATILEIANALFGNQSVKFKEAFLSVNKKYFDCEVSSLDFSAPASLAKINSWVSEKTHAKIPTIIQSVDPKSVLFLINAVYFKGTWAQKFEKALTKQAPFKMADGSVKNVSMMNSVRKDFRYLQTDDFQAVALPYADGRLSLYVILPINIKPLNIFEAEMTQEKWNEWLGKFANSPGSLAMPRFKIDDDMLLNDPLSQMGMGVAFQPKSANFVEMVDQGDDQEIFISKVIQKTFMDVTEDGTEAAAATVVAMPRGLSIPDKKRPFYMTVDHPFIVAIVDETTRATLFIGHVADPVGGSAPATK